MADISEVPALLNAVTDEMVDALALVGTSDDVHHQLEAFDGLVDTVLLCCPHLAVEPTSRWP